MNMRSDRRTSPTLSDYPCFNTTQRGTSDPLTSEFLGLTAAMSETIEPW